MKIPVTTIRLPTRPAREYESRFDREQSLLKMLAIPITSVAIASMITALPIFTEEPLLPPLGLLMFLSWRLMRPGLLPVWSGVPFGLMDDLFSGQPFGSAGLLWSLAMLSIEIIDARADLARSYSGLAYCRRLNCRGAVGRLVDCGHGARRACDPLF